MTRSHTHPCAFSIKIAGFTEPVGLHPGRPAGVVPTALRACCWLGRCSHMCAWGAVALALAAQEGRAPQDRGAPPLPIPFITPPRPAPTGGDAPPMPVLVKSQVQIKTNPRSRTAPGQPGPFFSQCTTATATLRRPLWIALAHTHGGAVPMELDGSYKYPLHTLVASRMNQPRRADSES